MAKISLNENELRSLIQEAISNVKVSDKPKKIKVKLSELKEIVKSVLKEYKYTPTPGFDVEAEFETSENRIRFAIIARFNKNRGEQPELQDYAIADEEQFKQRGNETAFQEVQEYLNTHARQIGEVLFKKAEQEDPEFEGNF